VHQGWNDSKAQITANHSSSIDEIFELSPVAIAKVDIARSNLLCAISLFGSEGLAVDGCLARVDRIAEQVRRSTERNVHRFPTDRDYGHCEQMWRMAMLVTVIKLDFGVTFDPNVKADLDRYGRSAFTDSCNVFIHGLLVDDKNHRWGSCSSIPVLVAAVARRLGYPVSLALTRLHAYARWEDDDGTAFNIEASNPMGMTSPDDDHYRNLDGGLSDAERDSNYYCRCLSGAEEFALFCKARVWSLHDSARFAESLIWSARALQFSPDDPHFAHHAYATAMSAVRQRYQQRFPDRFIPPPERNHEFFFQYDDVLAIEERSLFMTIAAHKAQALGQIDKARGLLIESAQQNFHGTNEQRDLQRFITRFGRPRRTGPVLPPQGIGQPRRLTLPNCPAVLEYDVLHRLADQFEREGKWLHARDVLHDLYLFDPCNAEVFARARQIESLPAFQQQLHAALDRSLRNHNIRGRSAQPQSLTLGRIH
jgi:hypothetical protein